MYLLSVIPISRGNPLESLTYISPTPIERGAVIHVPVRNTSTPALVWECRHAEGEKAQIKHLGFAMKVLKSPIGTQVFLPELMTTLEELATWYVGTPGSVLASLVPTPILRARPERPKTRTSDHARGEHYVLQSDLEERIALYKSIIREEFARKRSVLFLLPSIQDIDLWNTKIDRGISDYTHIIHGGMTPKKLLNAWEKALHHEHPVLILGTPHALSLPRGDIGTIIVERESASVYKALFRPYLDYRKAAEILAKHVGARCIFGDQFLRMETLWREEHGELQPLVKSKFRIVSPARAELVDVSKKEQPAIGAATLLSPQLLSLLHSVHDRGGHMAILGARKGYASQTVCGDCGTVVLCTRCSSPVVLYIHGKGAHTDKENVFLCHRCGEKRSAAERCRECTSWRLMPLGIGLDRAEEIIKREVPHVKIFRFDRDHLTSHKEARKLMEEFQHSSAAILLGTEMMLPYLETPVTYGAILSLQSLLTIPDVTMEERVFRLIATLRAKVTNLCLIQTRDTTLPWYEWALQGNILEWYRHESTSRKTFNYPPFSIIIKLSAQGSKEQVKLIGEDLQKRFASFSPIVFPGFVSKVKNNYRIHAMMTIPKGKWPDPKLIEALKDLPQKIQVQIEPESLI